jgi:hypothetical protein
MLNDEVVSVVSRFFDGGKGPSHEELTRMFQRTRLHEYDPLEPGVVVGKMKRCREVLSQAIDQNQEAGEQLVKMIMGAVKASGGFRDTSENYAGNDLVEATRQAFRATGYELDPEGNLRPVLLENLTGPNATEALMSYVRRARVGSTDAALVVGTGKDLMEATARHVLVQTTGTYPDHGNFPATLFQAFERLGLACPGQPMINGLDNQNPKKAVEQAICLLGMAVNRLRNAEGTGHGRPYLTSVSDEEAHLATQAMGIVSQFLLNKLP